jgi:hypothetical protein
LDALDAASFDTARVELLRQGLLWSRLGLFPGDGGGELGRQLIEASEQLRQRQGETGLSISTSEEAGVPFFVLRGDRSRLEQAGSQSGG